MKGILTHALKAVISFKLRSFFCIFSVALGIAAITIIVAAVEGAYKKPYEIVDRFGPDSILIFSGSARQQLLRQRQKTLTLEDAARLQQAFPSISMVVPAIFLRSIKVSYQSKRHQTTLVGATHEYTKSWRWPVVEGSDLTIEDVRRHQNVCLLGQYVSKKFFHHTSPVGKYLIVKNRPCLIIGVLSERGATSSGRNLDDRIVMPLSTVMKKFQKESKYITAIRVVFRNDKSLKKKIEAIKSFLRQRHGLKSGQEDDFMILSPEEILKFLASLSLSLVALLGISGIVTLIVAGFVLANLFLLSVKERASEIGIRRAVGAKKRHIIYQILLESSIITLTGGFVGFLFGWLASKAIIVFADFPLPFSWRAFVVGLFLALVTGIIFGLKPARQAANLNPIEAIR